MNAFSTLPHDAPTSDEDRVVLLTEPGFGRVFTDHMVTIRYMERRCWYDATLGPRGPVSLDPAAAVVHHAQEIFEGLKAYRLPDGGVASFRPDANAPVVPRRVTATIIKIILIEVPPSEVGMRGGRAACDLEIGYKIAI